MIPKEMIGQWLIVRFDDHTMGHQPEENELEVCGRVVAVTPKRVTLQYCTCVSPDPDVRKGNSEQFKILQADIIDVDILEKVHFIQKEQ